MSPISPAWYFFVFKQIFRAASLQCTGIILESLAMCVESVVQEVVSEFLIVHSRSGFVLIETNDTVPVLMKV